MASLMNGAAPVQALDQPSPSLMNGGTASLAPPPTQADAWDANSKAYTDFVAKERADGVAKGLIDPKTGWPTKAGLEDASRQLAESIMMGTTAPGAKGFTAYHGSPHSFDQFQSSAIGSGEGAQAYGHGLYFAENEGVAKSYRDGLSPPAQQYLVDGQPIGVDLAHKTGLSPEQTAASRVALKGFDQAMADNEKLKAMGGPFAKTAENLAPALENLRGKSVTTAPLPTGHMYEVGINSDPAHFLDWDKPIDQQHPVVQDALKKLGAHADAEDGAGAYGILTSMSPGAANASERAAGVSPASNAAAALKAAGIPGIRYLDGGSRADGAGTSNHVVFDPATIAILRKYGIAGVMSGGAAAAASKQDQTQ